MAGDQTGMQYAKLLFLRWIASTFLYDSGFSAPLEAPSVQIELS